MLGVVYASVLRLVTAWMWELGEELFVACAFRDKGCLILPLCYAVEMDYRTLLGCQILGDGRGNRAAGTCPDMPLRAFPCHPGKLREGCRPMGSSFPRFGTSYEDRNFRNTVSLVAQGSLKLLFVTGTDIGTALGHRSPEIYNLPGW